MTWENLVILMQIIIALVTVSGGVMYLTQGLKHAFKLEGNAARVLNNVVALAASFVALVAAGELNYVDFNYANLAVTIGVLHAGSREFYSLLTETEGRFIRNG